MKRKSKKIIAIVLAAAAVTAAAVTGIGLALTKKGPFTGTVKDSAGAPLTGVSVTDGRHVVKTAEDGSFTLPSLCYSPENGRLLPPIAADAGHSSCRPFMLSFFQACAGFPPRFPDAPRLRGSA